MNACKTWSRASSRTWKTLSDRLLLKTKLLRACLRSTARKPKKMQSEHEDAKTSELEPKRDERWQKENVIE